VFQLPCQENSEAFINRLLKENQEGCFISFKKGRIIKREMGNIYLVPTWFFGYDVALELLFAVITLAVSIYALRLYRLSGQKQSRFFGLGFLFISASYFVQSFINFAIISKLNENICTVLKINSIALWNYIGMNIYAVLFLSGLITLVYTTFKIDNPKLYSLLLLTLLASMLSNPNMLHVFHLISSILLVYLVMHYLMTYLKKKKSRVTLVLVAFIFILFGNVHFIFSINHSPYYVIGHLLELVGYICILTNLVRTVKK
jgi:hypothetical protein